MPKQGKFLTFPYSRKLGGFHNISVLAEAAHVNTTLGLNSTNGQFLSSVAYQKTSAVVRQCDSIDGTTNRGNIAASSAKVLGNPGHNRNLNNGSKSRTPFSELLKTEQGMLMMKYQRDTCGKYGHWRRQHNADGTLLPGVKSVNTPGGLPQNRSNESTDRTKQKTVSFSMARLMTNPSCVTSNSCNSRDSSLMNVETSRVHSYGEIQLGTLLDDGAPYTAIRAVELTYLASNTSVHVHSKLDVIPDTLKGHTHWQYGTGKHASAKPKILGLTVIEARSDNGRSLFIKC